MKMIIDRRREQDDGTHVTKLKSLMSTGVDGKQSDFELTADKCFRSAHLSKVEER